MKNLFFLSLFVVSTSAFADQRVALCEHRDKSGTASFELGLADNQIQLLGISVDNNSEDSNLNIGLKLGETESSNVYGGLTLDYFIFRAQQTFKGPGFEDGKAKFFVPKALLTENQVPHYVTSEYLDGKGVKQSTRWTCTVHL